MPPQKRGKRECVMRLVRRKPRRPAPMLRSCLCLRPATLELEPEDTLSVAAAQEKSVEPEPDPDWSNLLPELVSEVGDLLLQTDVTEYVRLRAVCKPWRGATKDPRIMEPRFFPRNWALTRRGNRSVNVLTGASLHFQLPDHVPAVEQGGVIATAEGYLILDQQQPPSLRNRLLLFNPVTATVADLPYLNVRGKSGVQKWLPKVTSAGIIYDDEAATVTVVLCVKRGSSEVTIFCAKPGDTAWVVVDASCVGNQEADELPIFQDGLSMGGNFYVPTRPGDVLKVELHPSPHLAYVARLQDDCYRFGGTRSYLVPSLDVDATNDGMLLVRSLCNSDYDIRMFFHVFGVNIGEGSITLLQPMQGNRTIFLPSLTLRTGKFPALTGMRGMMSRDDAAIYLQYI